MLHDILQDLINQNNGFTGIVQKLTKDLKSRILEETKNLPLKSQFDERIYNILNYHQIPVCDKGNQFKFKSFTEGYARFCGANCECANSKRAEFRTNFAKNRSKEDKDKTEQKKKTSIEEARKWTPTSTFNFDDLVDYLKKRIEKCKKNQGVVYKTLPYFIEDEIKKYTSYLPEEALLNERVYNILYPGNRKTCSCGNPSKFHSFNVGYRKYCSLNCEGFNKDHSEHMKEHYKNLSEEEKQRRVEKQQETSLENWGYTSHMKSPEYMKEYQQNLVEKFGVTNVFEIPEVKEKNKKNNLEKYGVEYPFQNPEFQAAALEKSKEAHGGEYCKKAREAYKEKTGFDSCFQDPEWQEKTRINRMIDTGWGLPKPTIIFDEYNSVECPVCGEKSKVLSPEHLKSHGINSAEEFRELYPDIRRVSWETSDKISEGNTGREVTVEHRMNYRNARIKFLSEYDGNGRGRYYDTKPELEFEEELKKLNIPYTKQFHTKQPHFNYDFLLWDCVLVEIDGPHHRDVRLHSFKKNLDFVKMRDELKTRGAFAHGYLLGRIEVVNKLPIDWENILLQQGINLRNNSYRKRQPNNNLLEIIVEDLKKYLELKRQSKEEE